VVFADQLQALRLLDEYQKLQVIDGSGFGEEQERAAAAGGIAVWAGDRARAAAAPPDLSTSDAQRQSLHNLIVVMIGVPVAVRWYAPRSVDTHSHSIAIHCRRNLQGNGRKTAGAQRKNVM